jgi:hypothetical protein
MTASMSLEAPVMPLHLLHNAVAEAPSDGKPSETI